MLTWLGADSTSEFPATSDALQEPNGLLAAGGDLSPTRLLNAYRLGIFPWFDEGQPILWWSPEPRMVLVPDQFHASRSLRRASRAKPWRYSINRAFSDVLAGCAAPRLDQPGTWITPQMQDAYCRLHELGWAHSVEVWLADELVGGIYGLAIDRVFFGESMFSRTSNASKLALQMLCTQLQRENFGMLDCQMHTPHLASLGAQLLPRPAFEQRLEILITDLKAHAFAPTFAMQEQYSGG